MEVAFGCLDGIVLDFVPFHLICYHRYLCLHIVQIDEAGPEESKGSHGRTSVCGLIPVYSTVQVIVGR